MLDLILDTSADPHFLCLVKEGKILATEFFPHLHNLSALLVPSIESLLKNNQYTVQDLSRLFVGVGPGSYTGVRVAVAVATSLSLALNISLYPFCSLLAFLPENLPDGHFTYLACSPQATSFVLQGFIQGNQLLNITHELIEQNEIQDKIPTTSSIISLSPDKIPKNLNLQVFPGSPNLSLLLPYLLNLASNPPLPPDIYYLHQF